LFFFSSFYANALQDAHKYRAIGYSRREQLPAADGGKNNIRMFTTKYYIRFYKKQDSSPPTMLGLVDQANAGM